MLSEVSGQAGAVRYLRRVAEGRLRASLLLVGEAGVGRRFSAMQTAKEAWSGGVPGSFHSFQIDNELHPDFIVMRPQDGKDIGIDAIREVVAEVHSFPIVAPRRFVVIDGADTMTAGATDALLKVLEEPPSTVQFFLIAESLERLAPTIRSRCGLIRYNRLDEALITTILGRFEGDPTKAKVYSRLAEGSVGRALQYWGASRIAFRNQVLALLRPGADISTLFSAIDELDGELSLALRFLEQIFRDLRMCVFDSSALINLDVAQELMALRRALSGARLRQLELGLRAILSRSEPITLAFHTKALFASVFAGS